MLNFIHYINKDTKQREEALIDKDKNQIIFCGNYIENKINYSIYSFFQGLQYGNVKYNCETIILSKEEYEKLGLNLNFHYEDINYDFIIDYSCNGMNNKDDEDIQINKNIKNNKNEEIIIDDIEAFLRGDYD